MLQNYKDINIKNILTTLKTINITNITYLRKIKLGDNFAMLFTYSNENNKFTKILYNFNINKIMYREKLNKKIENRKEFINETLSYGIISTIEAHELDDVFKNLSYNKNGSHITSFQYNPIDIDKKTPLDTGFIVYNEISKTRTIVKPFDQDIKKELKRVDHINVEKYSLIKFLLESKQL